MGRAEAGEATYVGPVEAFSLWTDLERWGSFVDGFGRVVSVTGAWPAEGAELVWRSTPGGRGEVTERVVESEPGRRLVTEVSEEALSGTQTVSFEPVAEAGDPTTSVLMRLDYELARRGPLTALTDLLFIRRALRDSLRRTLRRFAAEAAAGPGL